MYRFTTFLNKLLKNLVWLWQASLVISYTYKLFSFCSFQLKNTKDASLIMMKYKPQLGVKSIWNILSQTLVKKPHWSQTLSWSSGLGLIYGACQLNEKGRNYSHISGQCRSGAFLRELARVKNDAVRAVWAAVRALQLLWRTNEPGIVNNQPLCETTWNRAKTYINSTTPFAKFLQ